VTLTPAQFRADFPEFSDTSKFSDAMLTTWIAASIRQVDEERWADSAVLGAELCAAHFIVLAARDQAQAVAGGLPGAVTGIQTSKSVSDVSVSYDVGSVLAADAGHWNSTTYGIRFSRLQRLFGAGGVQI
jgi:Protein of unknown function (DUF4054)